MTPPRFEIQWLDENVGSVRQYDAGVVVGELFWNGNEWLFIRHDKNDEQVMDGLHHIPCDPEAEAEDRNEELLIARQEPEGARIAMKYELNGRRELRRDDTRELAEVGAMVEARKWWAEEFLSL